MRTVNRFLSFTLVFLMLAFLVISPAYGKTEALVVDSSSSFPLDSELQTKVEELQKRIKSFSESETEEVAKGLNVTLDQLKERTEQLQETLAFYNRQLIALKKHESLIEEKTILEKRIETGEAFRLEQSPPYSLMFFDEQTKNSTESIRKKQTAEIALSVAKKALENAKIRVKDAGQQIRNLKGNPPDQKDAEATLRHNWEIDSAAREEELAKVILSYQELVLLNAKKDFEIAEIRENIARQQLERTRSHLFFDKVDLEKQLAAIDERKDELQKNSNDFMKKLNKYEFVLVRVQKKLEQAKSDEEQFKAKAEVTAADYWRKTYQQKLEQNEAILQLFNLRKQLWKQRYELVTEDVDTKKLKLWRKEVLAQSDKFQQSSGLLQSLLTNLQLQVVQIEEQLAQNGLSSDLKGILKDQREALVVLIKSTFNYQTILNTTQQMHLRFIDEIAFEMKKAPITEALFAQLSKVKVIWAYELIVVDEQSVTIGKIVTAIVLLIIGIFLTGLFSAALKKRLLENVKLTESSAAITEKLVRYFIVLVIILISMNIVNIPLTAFTFLGGALAIGVGFGAQKLINNFISGFILMAEQPIKVGDLIQMEDELGWIEDIGVRSTRVRTFSNINIIVPNSYFLENNITNWTHMDKIVRCKVSVGVIYGSPTQEVKRLLLLAAGENHEIRKKPEPYVWFSDFGDNALIFDLYFWISVSVLTGRQRIESDTRFKIDELFREAGIVIAFPQRDVHLDCSKPLQFEMMRHNDESAFTP